MTQGHAPARLAQLGRAGGLLFGAKITATGVAFLTVALLARVLGPVSFGDFTILRTLFLLAAGLIGPAIDMALVRFGARGICRAVLRFPVRKHPVVQAGIVVCGCP